jgi:transketolase
MLNANSKLNDKLFSKDVEKVPTRDGFGHGLVEAGEADERIVAVCADLAESTRAHWFKEKFPKRYVEVGVAEQNLATVASGMANYGKIPFIMSYATFSPGRNNEQIRTTICINNVPVKIAGCHAGISVGPDGATHQALEDIGLMRMLPRMVVINPCDSEEARKATLAAAKHDGPVYIRLGREKTPVITTKNTSFEIGKAEIMWKSKDPVVAIVSTGALTHNALMAAKELGDEGIHTVVINLATIKPLDMKMIEYIGTIGRVVTVEEHQIHGGMGSAVAEALAMTKPCFQEFIGVHDQFGQSGKPDELIAHYGMDVSHIKIAVKKVMKRR